MNKHASRSPTSSAHPGKFYRRCLEWHPTSSTQAVEVRAAYLAPVTASPESPSSDRDRLSTITGWTCVPPFPLPRPLATARASPWPVASQALATRQLVTRVERASDGDRAEQGSLPMPRRVGDGIVIGFPEGASLARVACPIRRGQPGQRARRAAARWHCRPREPKQLASNKAREIDYRAGDSWRQRHC